MAESPPSADIGWSMSYRRFSLSAGYQLHKPLLYHGCTLSLALSYSLSHFCASITICSLSRLHQVTTYLFQHSCLGSPYLSLSLLLSLTHSCLLSTFSASITVCSPSRVHTIKGSLGHCLFISAFMSFGSHFPISHTLPPYTLAPPAHSPCSSPQLPSHLPTAKGSLGHWLYLRIFSPRYTDL